MQTEYSLKLRCATCGCDDKFEFNEDKSYVKCTFCNREYFGGIEELKELHEKARTTQNELKEIVFQYNTLAVDGLQKIDLSMGYSRDIV